jgi:hypothetical protein
VVHFLQNIVNLKVFQGSKKANADALGDALGFP